VNLKHLRGAILALIFCPAFIMGSNLALSAEQREKVPSLSSELEGIADINQVQPMSDYEKMKPSGYDPFRDLRGDDNRVLPPKTFEGPDFRFRSD